MWKELLKIGTSVAIAVSATACGAQENATSAAIPPCEAQTPDSAWIVHDGETCQIGNLAVTNPDTMDTLHKTGVMISKNGVVCEFEEIQAGLPLIFGNKSFALHAGDVLVTELIPSPAVETVGGQ